MLYGEGAKNIQEYAELKSSHGRGGGGEAACFMIGGGASPTGQLAGTRGKLPKSGDPPPPPWAYLTTVPSSQWPSMCTKCVTLPNKKPRGDRCNKEDQINQKSSCNFWGNVPSLRGELVLLEQVMMG